LEDLKNMFRIKVDEIGKDVYRRKNVNKKRVLDIANLRDDETIAPFVREVIAALEKDDYGELIRMCGGTDAWDAKYSVIKAKMADQLAASFFQWEEEEEDGKKKKKKKGGKKKKKKKKKEEAGEGLSLQEQMALHDEEIKKLGQCRLTERAEAAKKKEEEEEEEAEEEEEDAGDLDTLQDLYDREIEKSKNGEGGEEKTTLTELSLQEQMAAYDEEIANLEKVGVEAEEPPRIEREEEEADSLRRVYIMLFGEAPPKKMKKLGILLGCEDEVGIVGEGDIGARVAALRIIVL